MFHRTSGKSTIRGRTREPILLGDLLFGATLRVGKNHAVQCL